MSTNLAIVAFFLLAAATVADAGTNSEKNVTFTSYGAAHIGMPRAALASALGSKLESEYPDSDTDNCEYLVAESGYKGVSFMLIDQKLARIDVSDPTIKTASGAHIGSSEISVRQLYAGRIEVSPHAYSSPDGSYLTVLSRDKKHGVRFETLDGKVTDFYAGTAEAIQYIEGCL